MTDTDTLQPATFLSIKHFILRFSDDYFPLTIADRYYGGIEYHYTPEEKNAVNIWDFSHELSSDNVTWVLLWQTSGHWHLDRGIVAPVLYEPYSVLLGIASQFADMMGECVEKNGNDVEYFIYSLPLKPLEGKEDNWTVAPVQTFHKKGIFVDVSSKTHHWSIELIARSLIGLKVFKPSLEKESE